MLPYGQIERKKGKDRKEKEYRWEGTYINKREKQATTAVTYYTKDGLLKVNYFMNITIWHYNYRM